MRDASACVPHNSTALDLPEAPRKVFDCNLEFAYFDFEQCRARAGRVQRTMDFPRAGTSEDGFGVLGAYSSAWHDPDAACRCRYQMLEISEAVRSMRLSARSEDSNCSGGDDGFESIIQICAKIESAVKGHGQGMRVLHQRTSSFAIDVHALSLIQEPEDDSVEADFFRYLNFAFHALEFRVGINEVAGARANHSIDGNSDLFACGSHERYARSYAARRQIAAKLDPVGSAVLRRDGVGDLFDTNFN